jgi:O6-methylguanine-DNA--protein-cysteine methyltransferase
MTDQHFALFETRIGLCAIAWGPHGINGTQLPMGGEQKIRTRIHQRHADASEAEPTAKVQQAIDRITKLLAGEPDDLTDIPLDLHGVPEFNRAVYDIARTIPPGKTITYGDIAKQLGGVLPEPGAFSDSDKAILAQADAMLEASRNAMATQQIHQWLNTVWAVVAEANRYFAGEAPWALAKTDPARQKTVLYVTAEVVRQIAILAQPVMPESSAKLLDSLGIPPDARNFAALGDASRIAPGTSLPPPVAVFPRYVEPKAD